MDLRAKMHHFNQLLSWLQELICDHEFKQLHPQKIAAPLKLFEGLLIFTVWGHMRCDKNKEGVCTKNNHHPYVKMPTLIYSTQIKILDTRRISVLDSSPASVPLLKGKQEQNIARKTQDLQIVVSTFRVMDVYIESSHFLQRNKAAL